MSDFKTPKNSDSFTVETYRTGRGDSVSFSPGRGGITTSLVLDGTELLYMDEATFDDPSKNVRGGVPILFPNTGPLESPDYPNLPQHGVARLSDKWRFEKKPDGFSESFEPTERDVRYPYLYSLELKASLSNNSCTITEQIKNVETDKRLPISMGLHPYFYVPYDLRKEVTFNFKGSSVVRETFEEWVNNKSATFIDNPGIMKINIPRVGILELEASPEYRKIAFWALPDKDFVSIEPVMRLNNGLVDDPMLIPPGQSFSADFRIGFKKAS